MKNNILHIQESHNNRIQRNNSYTEYYHGTVCMIHSDGDKSMMYIDNSHHYILLYKLVARHHYLGMTYEMIPRARYLEYQWPDEVLGFSVNENVSISSLFIYLIFISCL